MYGRDTKCRDKNCPLNNTKLNPLQKIREYCKECVSGHFDNEVRQCTGEVLNPEFHICSLHPFRLGHKKQ